MIEIPGEGSRGTFGCTLFCNFNDLIYSTLYVIFKTDISTRSLTSSR